MPNEAPNLTEVILNRIKDIEGAKTDKDIGQVLATDPKTVAGWRHRDSVPWEKIIDYSRARQVSLEYLVNGIGGTKRSDLVMEPGAIYRVTTNLDALYEIAADVYRALREAGGEIPPEKFGRLVRLVHREMLDKNENSVPYAKILEMVKLAV